MTKIQRQGMDFLLVFATAAGSILPALIVLVSGHTLVWRDTSKLFQPIRPLIVDAVRNVELPLWNPHEALGIPLFAQMMHGVLHPLSVLGAFLVPHAGMDVFIPLYTALAALGSCLLARVLGASPVAATIAGLGYGLSGYVLGMGSIVQYLVAAATAPWTMIGLRWAGEERRFGTPVAAVAVAVLSFAGDPQWTIIAVLLGAVLAADAGGIRGLGKAAVGAVIGSALAGIQILPTMAYLRETVRADELGGPDRLQWALAPWRIVEFLVPGFFGSPGALREQWPVFLWLGGPVQRGFQMPFVPSIYVGAGVLLLAARGLVRSRTTRLLGIASLVLLWLALGADAGAAQIAHHLPVWGKFRYAEKMVGPLTLCLSVLAAFGADGMAQGAARSWWIVAGASGATAFLLALVLAQATGLDHAFSAPPGTAAVARHNLAVGLVHAGAILLALACLVVAARRSPRFRSHFPAAVAGLVFLQSAVASSFAMHAGDRSVREERPLREIIRAGEITRIATPLEQNYLYPPGLNDFDAQIGVQSHLAAPAYNVPSGIGQFNTYTGLRPRRHDDLVRTFSEMFGFDSPIAFRRYAVTHMIIKDPYFPDEAEVAKAARAEGVKVVDDRTWGFTGWSVPHRPWAAFAEQVVVAPDGPSALKMLVQALAQDVRAVVLEGAPQPQQPPSGQGQVLQAARGNNWLRIDATSDGDGVLVVNDTFWPGWIARIDGREVPLWRADFLVRAVPWPRGRHVLEMRYDPPEVTAGWLITLTGGLAVAALSVLEWRRLKVAKHRTAEPAPLPRA